MSPSPEANDADGPPRPPAEPEWSRLRALSEELHALREAGKLDAEAFERIMSEVEAAAHGFNEVYEAFYNFDPSKTGDVPPDWERLKALDAEMHALIDAGKLDRAAFNRIVDEAEPLAHGFGEALESFYLFEPDPRDP